MTMIYVTHDQTEAMTLADRIVVLRAGRIEQIGRAARPLRRPGEPVRRRLRRLAADELPGRRGASAATARPDARARQPGRRRGCTLPPRRRRRRRPAGASASGPSISPTPGEGDCDLTVDVDVAEHLGSTSYVYANTKGGEQLVDRARGIAPPSARDRLTVSIPARPHLPLRRRRRTAALTDPADKETQSEMTTHRKLRWGILGPGTIARTFAGGVAHSRTGDARGDRRPRSRQARLRRELPRRPRHRRLRGAARRPRGRRRLHRHAASAATPNGRSRRPRPASTRWSRSRSA